MDLATFALHQRRDAALGTLATVGALTLTITGATGTEYGDWGHYGVTDPMWIGVVQEALFSVAWFLQLASVIDSLQLMALGAYFDVPAGPQVLPYVVFTLGVFVYHINLYFVDVAYWFNYFVNVPLYDLAGGNVQRAMYLADVIPMTLFVISSVATLTRRILDFRARSVYHAQHARRARAVACGVRRRGMLQPGPRALRPALTSDRSSRVHS
jgi:hypothetical protein